MNIKIRKIKLSDMENCMDYFNEAVRDHEKISYNSKITLNEEEKWIKSVIQDMNSNKKIFLVAEYENCAM